MQTAQCHLNGFYWVAKIDTLLQVAAFEANSSTKTALCHGLLLSLAKGRVGTWIAASRGSGPPYLTDAMSAATFSGLAFMGTSQPLASMKPPFMPIAMSFSQYSLTSSGVPIMSIAAGTSP